MRLHRKKPYRPPSLMPLWPWSRKVDRYNAEQRLLMQQRLDQLRDIPDDVLAEFGLDRGRESLRITMECDEVYYS